MALLKNLKINKVSFVRRAANKRKFLLLKAEDSSSSLGEESSISNNNNDNNNKGGAEVRSEVKTKLTSLFKTEKDTSKLMEVLKGDKELKLSDEEVVEVQNTLELLKSVSAEPQSPPPKADGNNDGDGVELKKVLEENKALLDRVEKMETDTLRRDTAAWVKTHCPYLPDGVEKTVDKIIEIQKASPTAAEMLKEELKRSSAALQESATFSEIGVSAEGIITDDIGGDLLAEVQKSLTEIRKSGEMQDLPQKVADIVRAQGAEAYNRYRAAHIRRAKTEVAV
jgi:hypothetical protein